MGDKHNQHFLHPCVSPLDISPIIGRGLIFHDTSDENAVIPQGTLIARSAVLEGIDLCDPALAKKVKEEFDKEQKKQDEADAKAGKKKPRLGSHDDIAGRPSPASRVELGVLSLALRLHDRTKDPSAPGTSVMPESFADLMPRSYPDDPETGVLKDEERTVAFRRFLAIMESVKSWDGVDLSAMPPDERTHVAFWMEKVARNSLLKSFGKSKRRRMVVLGGSSTNVNHACIPNAVWKLRGAAEADESTSANGSSGTIADVVEVWAARDIVNGEEISVPYVPVRDSKVDMLESMFKECGFRCRCEGCSRVYRAIEESWDDSTFPGRGVYKGQDGTSVLPFRASEAKWLLREFGGDRGTFCWWCGKDSGDDAGGVELQTCAQCKVMRYCGKACQKSSWQASHKGLCTTMIEWREKGELG